MKKTVLILGILFIAAPMFAAEEITPNFSNYKNYSGVQNTSRPTIPALERSKSIYDYNNDYDDEKPVSDAREIKKNPTQQSSKAAPMTYGNFPQNYDGMEAQMMMQQFGRLPGQY